MSKLHQIRVFHQTYWVVLQEIGAIQALKEVASSPDETAAKFASEALTVIGEEVPYKLAQQVPSWTVNDVQYWVRKVRLYKLLRRIGVTRDKSPFIGWIDWQVAQNCLWKVWWKFANEFLQIVKRMRWGRRGKAPASSASASLAYPIRSFPSLLFFCFFVFFSHFVFLLLISAFLF